MASRYYLRMDEDALFLYDLPSRKTSVANRAKSGPAK